MGRAITSWHVPFSFPPCSSTLPGTLPYLAMKHRFEKDELNEIKYRNVVLHRQNSIPTSQGMFVCMDNGSEAAPTLKAYLTHLQIHDIKKGHEAHFRHGDEVGTAFIYYDNENGWYSNCKTPEGAVHFDDMLKRLLARTPYIAISEYGSGANPFCHSDNPAKTTRPSVGGARHDEEWGNIVHEIHLKSLCTNSRVQFSTGWILFDFAVGARREGYMLCNDGVNAKVDSSYMFLNDKGIVSRDRKVKKDAFYLYKACWNKKEPTVYITSRRFTERTSDTINVKVYSNLHDLTLYHNGRLAETLHATNEPTGVIWNFSPITFEKEYDEIMVEGTDAKGQKVQDKIKLRHISKSIAVR